MPRLTIAVGFSWAAGTFCPPRLGAKKLHQYGSEDFHGHVVSLTFQHAELGARDSPSDGAHRAAQFHRAFLAADCECGNGNRSSTLLGQREVSEDRGVIRERV